MAEKGVPGKSFWASVAFPRRDVAGRLHHDLKVEFVQGCQFSKELRRRLADFVVLQLAQVWVGDPRRGLHFSEGKLLELPGGLQFLA